MPKFALLLAAGLFVQIPVISAQEAQEETVEQPAVSEDTLRATEESFVLGENITSPALGTGPSIWAVIRMILVLALAAAAIYGAVYFIKRTTKQTASNDPFLKVLASSHLGLNRYVHIVHAGGKAYLVGSAEGGVNLISEVDNKETIDAMLLEESKKSSESTRGRFPDFMSLLKRFNAPVETRIPGADDIRKRRERLRGL